MSENESARRDNPEDDDETSPTEELAYAVSDLIKDQKVIAAVSSWIDALAKNKTSEPCLTKLSIWLGFSFGITIFVGIGLLGWKQVIPAEATTGLLGALIGYWFGYKHRQQ